MKPIAKRIALARIFTGALVAAAPFAASPFAFGQEAATPAALEAEASVEAASETPNLIHDRHLHKHNGPHATEAPTEKRFFTTRSSDVLLPLPEEKDAFTFAVYGDRTGGPDEGVNVLADAVRDTNLVEPDLVMTVGDLVQGYNGREEWLVQTREFKSIMNELICPWFPTSGNHDIYWRPLDDPDRPAKQHEEDYEMHFGPLWYAFEHKNCNFIVLFSDEGDAETGEKTFGKPSAQTMSDAQFEFLQAALERGKQCDHQFLFLHHPRWLGNNYGDDWTGRVHPMLKSAGNVTAVFAGHIHHMRYDPQDGIEYVTLATVGGGQSGLVPQAGFLHHWDLVTVRKNQVALASFPVGAAMNVREVTGKLQEEAASLARRQPKIYGKVVVGEQGPQATRLKVAVDNPTSRPIDFTLTANSRDNRWLVSPDHLHGRILPGESQTLELAVEYFGENGFDAKFDELVISLGQDLLAETTRYTIPTIETPVEIDWQAPVPTATGGNRALKLDGVDDAVVIASDAFDLPQGPFTLEAWMKADRFDGRTGLITKTEGSEYGIFVSEGIPSVTAHLGGEYRDVRVETTLPTGEWKHLAEVYDGESIALFIDGAEVARRKVDPEWLRKTNVLPLVIGGDTGGNGQPVSFFAGMIDEVRLSSTAMYRENFQPERRLQPTDDTVLLFNFDASFGPLAIDRGKRQAHSRLSGGARLVDVE